MSILWCCHVRGPDNLYPAASYEDALKMADEINAFDFQMALKRDPPELLARAAPAIWPWSAEDHGGPFETAAKCKEYEEHSFNRKLIWRRNGQLLIFLIISAIIIALAALL